jgi:hypothetical protein
MSDDTESLLRGADEAAALAHRLAYGASDRIPDRK